MPKLTFLFDFEHVDDRGRRYIMHEFAANGAKHIVLSDTLISQILKNDNLRKTVADEVAAEGLTFVDSHVPFGRKLDLNSPDKADRIILVERFKLVMEIIAQLGVDTMAVHVGSNSWMNEAERDLSRNIANMEDALEKILPTAERLGITLCIENSFMQTTTPDILLALKARFPTPALGFCYDAGHANIMASHASKYEKGTGKIHWNAAGVYDIPWEDHALEKMLPDLVNCHLHDNDGSDDSHNLPGTGNIDWPNVIALLNKAPRLKVIQCEVIPHLHFSSIRDICAKFKQMFPNAL